MNQQRPPAAGWYADPASADRHRYWDGAQWTENCREPPPDPMRTPLVIAGYATAVLSPIIGLILGIALLVRREAAHGSATIAISVVVGAAATLLWPTPLLISTWVSGVIAVFVVIPLALWRASRPPEVVWDGARWHKRPLRNR